MKPHEHDRMHEVEREHFWFVATRDIVLSLLQTYVGKEEMERAWILDAGCGTGYTLSRLAEAGCGRVLTGVDRSAHALHLARRALPTSVSSSRCSTGAGNGSVQLLQSALEHLPLAPESVDVILCLDVLEHLEDDAAGLQSVLRCLKPGGRLLLTVPSGLALWTEHDEALQHFRRYRRSEMKRLLQRAGCDIEGLFYFNTLLYPPILAVRALKRLVAGPRGAPGRPPQSDTRMLPPRLNRLLYKVLSSEASFVARFPLPFGVSLGAVACKPLQSP